MCNLIRIIESAGERYSVDGLAVSRDVFDAYRSAGHPCRVHDARRVQLRAASPMRSDCGRAIPPQDDASGLALFNYVDQLRLAL